VHDSVDLENRGIPAMFVASREFGHAAAVQSISLGMPDVQRVLVPHPIQDRTDEEMIDYANQAFDEIMAKITKCEEP